MPEQADISTGGICRASPVRNDGVTYNRGCILQLGISNGAGLNLHAGVVQW